MPKSTSPTLEVVSAADVSVAELSGIAAAIHQSIDLVASHEGAFEEATLEHRLQIGLHVAKAQEIFTALVPNPTGKNQHSTEVVSTVDTTNSDAPASHGFVSWLRTHVKRLKRPTAYRYAAAFRALELPLESNAAEIRAKIKTLRHNAAKANLPMPTVAGLVKAALKPEKPESLTVLVPKSSKQLKLEDARETFHAWMESWDKALKKGHLDHLDKKGLEQLKEFNATVRDRINARLK